MEYWVPDLLQGCEYEFRVSAENVVGMGDPSPATKPVFAKDPIGRLTINTSDIHTLTTYNVLSLRVEYYIYCKYTPSHR